MEEAGDAAIWLLGFMAGALVTIAAMGAVGLVAHGLARLAARTPGRLGRGVSAWERRERGAPTALACVALLLGFLTALWSGLLG